MRFTQFLLYGGMHDIYLSYLSYIVASIIYIYLAFFIELYVQFFFECRSHACIKSSYAENSNHVNIISTFVI